MMEERTASAAERIEAAVARIERAALARARENDSLARRHAELRSHMADAIVALDELIAFQEQR
jgi:hypothetical protein